MLSYESSLFLAVVGSLLFAGCAWLFSFGNSVDMFDELRRMDKRQVIYQFLNFAMIVSSALMLWKGLFVVTHCESPIVVVLSGSMQVIALHLLFFFFLEAVFSWVDTFVSSLLLGELGTCWSSFFFGMFCYLSPLRLSPPLYLSLIR
eukprot:sb/3473795/